MKKIENHESKPSISETVVNTFRNTDAFQSKRSSQTINASEQISRTTPSLNDKN